MSDPKHKFLQGPSDNTNEESDWDMVVTWRALSEGAPSSSATADCCHVALGAQFADGLLFVVTMDIQISFHCGKIHLKLTTVSIVKHTIQPC